MELIESEKNETKVLVEPEPRYHTASLPIEKTEHGQAWLRTLAAILITIIAIVLIVLFARWVYHKTNKKVQPTPTTGQQSTAESSAKGSTGKLSVDNDSTPNGSTPSRPSTSTENPTASNQQLPNSGPGDVVAIFVTTSLAAAGLHYVVKIRRFSKTGV